MPAQLPDSPELLNTDDLRGCIEVLATPSRRLTRLEEGAITAVVAVTDPSPLPPVKRDPAEDAEFAIFAREG